MEKEDLKQIREVFQEEFQKGFEQSFNKGFQESFGSVWEDNMEPSLNGLYDKFESLGKKLNTLPDKAYLDSKLASLEGSLIVNLRKEDDKVNLLIGILKDKNVLERIDIEMLEQIQVFPQRQKPT